MAKFWLHGLGKLVDLDQCMEISRGIMGTYYLTPDDEVVMVFGEEPGTREVDWISNLAYFLDEISGRELPDDPRINALLERAIAESKRE